MSQAVPILFTIPNFVTAGSGAALLNIVSRLDRERFAPAICVLRRGGSLDAEVERLRVPFFEARFTVAPRPLATLPVRARRAAMPFRGHGFALWHSFHYLDDYTEPLVARLAGARFWMYTKKNMNWNHRSWWLRTALATRVAAQNSDMMRSFFRFPLFRRKSSLVPRGVDTERFQPGVPQRLQLRARLKTPPNATVIGCVAQLVPVKGHPTLVEAVGRIPDAQLWLAGGALDPGYAADLKRQVLDGGLEDRVFFLDEIRDVPAFLSEIDIFALPTWDAWRMEGCPVALLEAMASGLACVATDIPGSRDIVEQARCGLLVTPRDPEALAEAICRLQSDARLRQELGNAARQRVLERYSIAREVRDYETIYAEALHLDSAG